LETAKPALNEAVELIISHKKTVKINANFKVLYRFLNKKRCVFL